MLHPKKFSIKAGMVLTEALVAIATLTMGVVALGSITTNAISTTIISKDYLIALNLLNEADEAVININYANWLLKPADKATCWLRLKPDNVTDPNCNSNAASGGNYIVVLDNGIWKMDTVTAGGLDLGNTNNESTNNQFQVYLDGASGGQGYFSAKNPPSGPKITKSKFFRSINFIKKDDTMANYMTRVQWRDGAQIREVRKKTTLYNY